MNTWTDEERDIEIYHTFSNRKVQKKKNEKMSTGSLPCPQNLIPPGDESATHTYRWGLRQVKDHRLVATQTDYRFLRQPLCRSCRFRGRPQLMLFFSLPFDPTSCKQAMLNAKENISSQWFQGTWKCCPLPATCLLSHEVFRPSTGHKQP